MSTETREFQAEARQLLELMIHSLYKHKEIFLRELVSNASDALDKVRFESLTNPELLAGDDRLHVRIEADAGKRTLTIADNGIGMSRDEVIENLGTIARSGTREFMTALAAARKDSAATPELIGQFGVGFYSSFMVADEVVVVTRRAGEEGATRWTSRGDGRYTIEETTRDGRGTTVTLHLKEKGEADEEVPDFTSEWRIRDVIKKYSDFVAWPIEMEVERSEGEGDDKKVVKKVETLNSMKPLWTRSPSEVTEEEHAEFYKHLTHDWEAPARTVHFRAEGTLEYTALLYIPSRKPLAMFETNHNKSRLSLYVKRVFIMDDCEELLPPWLRFVRGLVDSSDLPLNVSRETLQHTRQMVPIKKKLVAKVLETAKRMLEDEREAYEKVWASFGSTLKEGIYFEDEEAKFKVAEVCLFRSTRGDGLVSLDEYVEKMPFKQKEILFLAGADKKTLLASPHLEAAKKNGFEVLLLTDPVDEFAMQRLTEFDGKPVRSLERGELDLDDDDEKKEEREKKQEALKPLLDSVKAVLKDRVGDVRFSNRLTESPAVLVTGEHDVSPHMQRILREANQEVPPAARVLELNPSHPLVEKMDALRGTDDDRLSDYCDLLYGQALIAEGTPLTDPAAFNRLLTDLMVDR